MTSKNNKPKKPISFEIPLFGGEVWLCKSHDEWANAMKFCKETDDSTQSAGRCLTLRYKSGVRLYIVGVFDGSIGTLSHELSHAVFNLLRHVNVSVKADDSNETFCYLMGYLMYNALSHFKADTHLPEKKKKGQQQ